MKSQQSFVIALSGLALIAGWRGMGAGLRLRPAMLNLYNRELQRLSEAHMWTIPNILTAARIVLIVPFIYLIRDGRFGAALAIYFAASISDMFDGWIARHFNQQSSLGRILDPLADKFLTTASFIVMAFPHAGIPSIPVWLAVAVVMRDVIIMLGSMIVYLLTRYTEFKPSMLGKVNTFLEMSLIFFFLVFHTTGKFVSVLPACYWIVAATVLLSGLSYVVTGVRIVTRERAVH